MIKDLREKLGMSQARLAELAGTTQPQIYRLEKGERTLSKKWAKRLSEHLNVTPEILMFGWPDDPNEPHLPTEDPFPMSNATVTGRVEHAGVKIPVYGQAVGGVDGEFHMNGNQLYEVLAPPVISHISGAYGVCVSGDSMSPRYEDGEICFVDPRRRVKKGDYVIAQIRIDEDGPPLAYVKRFVRQNSVELVLEQFNPAKELRFPSSSVQSVHYIALSGDA